MTRNMKRHDTLMRLCRTTNTLASFIWLCGLHANWAAWENEGGPPVDNEGTCSPETTVLECKESVLADTGSVTTSKTNFECSSCKFPDCDFSNFTFSNLKFTNFKMARNMKRRGTLTTSGIPWFTVMVQVVKLMTLTMAQMITAAISMMRVATIYIRTITRLRQTSQHIKVAILL